MKKGSPILIEGRLKLDQWDDKQTGQKRSKLGVIVEGFQFLGSGNRGAESGGDGGAPAPRPRPSAPAPAATAEAEPDVPPHEGDDVPF